MIYDSFWSFLIISPENNLEPMEVFNKNEALKGRKRKRRKRKKVKNRIKRR